MTLFPMAIPAKAVSCRPIVTALFVLIAGAGVAVSDEPPSTGAAASLKKQSYPWYDSNRDAFRPLRPAKNDVQKSSDSSGRDNVRRTEPRPESSASVPLGQLLQWILLGIVIALIVVAIFKAIGNRSVSPETAPAAAATISTERLEALPESTRGVTDFLAEATRLRAAREFSKAMVLYHTWQLVELDKLQALELQKGKTNRRYLREINESRPDLAGLFRQSTRFFEDAFFGSLDVTESDFESVWNQRGILTSPQKGVRA